MASKKSTSKKSVKAVKAAKAPRRAATSGNQSDNGLRMFALHATESATGSALNDLRAARANFAGFAMANETGLQSLDPESAAYQHLRQALASETLPRFTNPQVEGTASDFKSLGTETLPLTNTTTVKFRQMFNKIPVYGSLVTVELDENNECLTLNSALGTPRDVNSIAKISPATALQKVAKEAGHGKKMPDATPQLNYYYDENATRWRLVYIFEDVPLGRGKVIGPDTPMLMDYIVDAHTGALIRGLPRTANAVQLVEDRAPDGLAVVRTFKCLADGPRKELRDTELNIATFDFGFQDPIVNEAALPGRAFRNPPAPWSPAAVSAHANASAVATFLRQVLRRNNIDNQGGAMVSSVNCVVAANSPDGRSWINAFWNSSQMVYGQRRNGAGFQSLAINLDIVAHEMFHGVTERSARLEYAGEPGALNESYSDIFGTIISNFQQPDFSTWNWEVGEGLTADGRPFRDMSDPARFGQPAHMNQFRRLPITERGDWGGVHTNSGIHNFAAHKVMNSKNAQGRFLFNATEVAAIFYLALTQFLSRRSLFSHSRLAVVQAARSFFRNDPALAAKITAIEQAYSAVGIQSPV